MNIRIYSVKSGAFFPRHFARLFLISVLPTALLLIANCATSQSAVAQDQQSAGDTLRGTVLNRINNQPIGRAQVYSGDNRFAAMTDDHGNFEFRISSPQESSDHSNAAHPSLSNLANMLIARKPGFLVEQNQIRPMQLSPNGELTLFLVPEAIISGHITLPGADTDDGIPVQLYRRDVRDGLAHWSPVQTYVTNSRGEFRFAELYAGSYRLGTNEATDRDPEDSMPGGKQFGFPPVYFPGASTFFSASTIALTAGQMFEAHFPLARKEYFPVKIAVANLPARGTAMNVNVTVQGDGAPGYSLGLGPQRTIVGSLPDGNYVVAVTTYGPEQFNGVLNLTVAGHPVQASMGLFHKVSIEVEIKENFSAPEANEQGNNVDRFARRLNRARGPRRYLNLYLEPVSDFGRGNGASLRPPTSPNDESMVLENVEPGRYWVRVNSSKGYAASVTSGGIDLQHHPLIVSPGASVSTIEITMRDDKAFLDGTVRGAAVETANSTNTGNFKPSAFVYCVPQDEGPGIFTQAVAMADGKFSFPPLPPGVYLVLAFPRPKDNLEYRNPSAMRAYESKGEIVQLGSGERETLEVPLIISEAENAE